MLHDDDEFDRLEVDRSWLPHGHHSQNISKVLNDSLEEQHPFQKLGREQEEQREKEDEKEEDENESFVKKLISNNQNRFLKSITKLKHKKTTVPKMEQQEEEDEKEETSILIDDDETQQQEEEEEETVTISPALDNSYENVFLKYKKIILDQDGNLI